MKFYLPRMFLVILGVTFAESRRIIILVGPPGAGKGTQSPNIVKALSIPHLSTGEMLRDAVSARTLVGLRAESAMNAGMRVDDSIVNGIVREEINRSLHPGGVILDGYPRNLEQAKFLDKVLAANGERVTEVIHFHVPERILESCVLGRWMSASGQSYNANSDCKGGVRPKSLPPGAEPICIPGDVKHCNMLDDQTGTPLHRRQDDNLKVLHARLKDYYAQTVPVLKHYSSIVRTVNGNEPEPKVWAQVEKALGVSPLDPSGKAELAVVSDLDANHRFADAAPTISCITAVAVLATIAAILVHRRPRNVMSMPLLETEVK